MLFEAVGLFLVVQISFLLGYVLGRLKGRAWTPDSSLEVEDRIFRKSFDKSLTKKKIEIDSGVFVTNSDESSLESKGATLGQQTVVDDDVSASASKLAMLKRNK